MKIIVVVCDRYADAAPAWVDLWRRFWPDCDYEAEFLTNKQRLAVELPAHYIHGEDIDFGTRMRTFLREHYKQEYLLITMADYFIKGPVDADLIRVAHQMAATKYVRHVRLRPMPPPQRPYAVDGLGRIDKKAHYALSLQPGIWESRVLYELCRDGENPWATEMRGSKRVRHIPGEFLSVDRYVMSHLNYYRKGKAQGLDWVRDNVDREAWPEAVRKEYGK